MANKTSTQRVITVEFTVKFENGIELTDQEFVDLMALKTGNKDVKVISRGLAEYETT